MELTWQLKIALAAIPIAWIASQGFGSPSWARSYTTASLYRTMWLAWLMLHLVVLIVLCAAARRAWGGQGSVWIGLSLGFLLSTCAPLMRVPREWFHRQAGIPSEAHALGKKLAESAIVLDQQTRKDAKQLLIKRGVDVDDEWSGLDVPARRLLETTALYLKVCCWKRDPRFRSFFREADNDYYLLRCHFDQLSLKIPRTLDSIRRIGEMLHIFNAERPTICRQDDSFQKVSRRVVGDLINDACKDISDFHDEACLFAARGALMRRVTGHGREKLLCEVGFTYTDDSRPTPFGVLAKAAVLLYVGIWTFTLLLPGSAPDHKGDISTSARVDMITVIILTSLCITVFIKNRWGFANADLEGRTPMRFLIGAGLCASLFAALVNLATGAMLLGGWEGAVKRLLFGWPFLHISGMTTFVVAWLVQDHRWRRTPYESTRRLFDALMLGSVWIIGSCLSLLLIKAGASGMANFAEHLFVALGDAPTVLSENRGMQLASFVFGAVLGIFVPESVRRAYPRAHVARSTASYRSARSSIGA